MATITCCVELVTLHVDKADVGIRPALLKSCVGIRVNAGTVPNPIHRQVFPSPLTQLNLQKIVFVLTFGIPSSRIFYTVYTIKTIKDIIPRLIDSSAARLKGMFLVAHLEHEADRCTNQQAAKFAPRTMVLQGCSSNSLPVSQQNSE